MENSTYKGSTSINLNKNEFRIRLKHDRRGARAHNNRKIKLKISNK